MSVEFEHAKCSDVSRKPRRTEIDDCYGDLVTTRSSSNRERCACELPVVGCGRDSLKALVVHDEDSPLAVDDQVNRPRDLERSKSGVVAPCDVTKSARRVVAGVDRHGTFSRQNIAGLEELAYLPRKIFVRAKHHRRFRIPVPIVALISIRRVVVVLRQVSGAWACQDALHGRKRMTDHGYGASVQELGASWSTTSLS